MRVYEDDKVIAIRDIFPVSPGAHPGDPEEPRGDDIKIDTRWVHLAGIIQKPTGAWVARPARNLIMSMGNRIDQRRFLIRDRDAKYTGSFDQVFASEGLRVIRTPIRPPKANAFAERFVGTVRRGCLDWLLVFSRRHLDKIITTYLLQSNCHRPPGARTAAADPKASLIADHLAPSEVRRQDLLGGLIHEYRSAA